MSTSRIPSLEVYRGTPSRVSPARLDANADTFEHLLDLAERRVGSGRETGALEWCRIAATFAMTNATGALRSSRLEALLDRIAARTLEPLTTRTAATPHVRRVLHVLTEAAAIGGLTRMATRWIGRDTESVSSVVVTRQHEVVGHLRDAVRASGGEACALGGHDALERARRLRAMAASADVVVCHLQPDDHVTALAFGAGYDGPPVAVYNHADHLFSLAPTRARLIVDFRDVGAAVTARGRGYAPAHTALLPLLVPPVPVTAARAAVRESLGVAADAVLVVSVARAVKFASTALRPTFADVAREILAGSSRVVLCGVGPEPDAEPWRDLEAAYPGRVHAVGPVAEPQRYLDAADIYLDTTPFSSLTSLLEAAASGLPTLTLDAYDGLPRALGVADFVLDPADRPRRLAGLVDRVAHLAASRAERAVAGTRARDAHRALAPQREWADRLRNLYARLERVPSHLGSTPSPEIDDELREYALALLAVEQHVPLTWTILAGLGDLDPRDRRAWSLRTAAARGLTRARATGADEVGAERGVLLGRRAP